MAKGKHRAAAQHRYDQHADQQIADLRRELVTANRERRDAEERAARADALQTALQRTTAERDANTAPEVRRLNETIVGLQDALREAKESAAFKERRFDGLWEKVWPLVPGGPEERFEWLMDVLPAIDGYSGAGGRPIRDPEIVATKNKVTSTQYQYLMQRIRGRRTSLKRPFHSIEARMEATHDRAELITPDYPEFCGDVVWLLEQLAAARDLARVILDLLLVGEADQARDLIADMLSKPPAQPAEPGY